jgi:hypothetical protein
MEVLRGVEAPGASIPLSEEDRLNLKLEADQQRINNAMKNRHKCCDNGTLVNIFFRFCTACKKIHPMKQKAPLPVFSQPASIVVPATEVRQRRKRGRPKGSGKKQRLALLAAQNQLQQKEDPNPSGRVSKRLCVECSEDEFDIQEPEQCENPSDEPPEPGCSRFSSISK